MKKLAVLLGVSVMLCAMPVSAASPTARYIMAEESTDPVGAGFRTKADELDAKERGMSFYEFYSNTIISTPGIKDAVAVGQGGKILINGVKTNATVTLSKVTKAMALHAAENAVPEGSTLLNVVKAAAPGTKFHVAITDFSVKDLAADTKVSVKMYQNGEWVDVTVTEVTEDHVVVELMTEGIYAFISTP